MTDLGSFERFDFTKLGDSHGGIGGIRTYSKTILPYLRTPQYDALLRGTGEVDTQYVVAHDNRHTPVLNRIAHGKLSMKGILADHALESVPGSDEQAADIHVGALHWLARMVQGGVDVRIATSATHDVISPDAADFSLIEYQDGRRGELVVTTPEGEHLIMAREGDSGFAQGSDSFNTVWEAPSTIQARLDVMAYLSDTAATMELHGWQ